MKALATALFMFWSSALWASHSYGGLDLCTLYPERMPPGMPLAELPQPDTGGARLLQQYCAQCHNLPGPGRHTAREWPAVMARMNLLMDTASRFGGLLGKVETASAQQKAIIEQYLVANALRPLTRTPETATSRSFVQYCAACHALPDPTQHTPQEWPQVIKRMQRNRDIMKHTALSPVVLLQIQSYLQQHAGVSVASDQDLATSTMLTVTQPDKRAPGLARWGSWLALGPFLLLAVIGVARWWRAASKRRPAAGRGLRHSGLGG